MRHPLLIGFFVSVFTFHVYAEAEINCPDVSSQLREFKKISVEEIGDLNTNEELARAVIGNFHQILDPFDLLTLDDERQPDIRSYIEAYETVPTLCGKQIRVLEEAMELISKFKMDIEPELKEVIDRVFHAADIAEFALDKVREADATEKIRSMAQTLSVEQRKVLEDYNLHSDYASFEAFILSKVFLLAFPALTLEEMDGRDSLLKSLVLNSFLQAYGNYNQFLSPTMTKVFRASLQSGTTGIGVVISDSPIGVIVRSVVEGGPAAKSGAIQKGDVIVSVEGGSVIGESLSKTADRIKGRVNTKVRLQILRAGENRDVVLTRGQVSLSKVKCHLRDDDIVYCKLPSFYQGVSQDFVKQLIDLIRAAPLRPRGLIVDLRGNLGGILEESISLSAILLQFNVGKDFVYVYEKQREEIVGHKGDGRFRLMLPLAILVDEHSASASEIVAGNVQAAQSGIIISDGASRTFGKGSVQQLLTLGEESLKLTQAFYFLLDGRSPEGCGVVPNIIFPIREVENLEVDPDRLQRRLDVVVELPLVVDSYLSDRESFVQNLIQLSDLEKTDEILINRTANLLHDWRDWAVGAQPRP